jgi:hypothetical protein
VFLSLSSVGQLYNTKSIPIKVVSESQYILGIGNQEESMFLDVLTYLENNTSIRVYAVCEQHRVIGVKVMDNVYRSYDVINELLISQYPSLLLYRKNDTIFKLDCKDEIAKQ